MTAERIVLVGGLWLDPARWHDVVAELAARGRDAVAVTLPVHRSATLEDQVAAVLAAVDAAPGPAVVAGHSAACGLAWLAADARPERVSRVAMIGGYPREDGQSYGDFFEISEGWMPFPGWAAFDGPDSADLDERARQEFESGAVPVPEGVARGRIRYTDQRRYDVPVVMICPEYSPEQAREWITAGRLPELSRAKHVDLVDIESGHWPMLTRPAELARILAAL
ncbi:alpha/beta fold hydrolase [Actinoplanes teichomyceticus]|uniref:Alpha/beta hydrolase family protein n=1 Tax=Actinoplanes teichomyceticus TaxID=1867 RepID=A0A561VL42_ACTTI|nr:alpha/beta hydrolase [Actinoplanes teichomyceticus]TWG12332.1 alpha/beta hydrolase family protein [Actinoplanes teichomyceticus]GIF14272.1 esterase [Actinoplanes teichomyceticus]